LVPFLASSDALPQGGFDVVAFRRSRGAKLAISGC
jgi:hypothetical protein